MSKIQKIQGFLYCLLGLFMIIVGGGAFLLQLLALICGSILLWRGVRLLFYRRSQAQFFTFFQEQDRFF